MTVENAFDLLHILPVTVFEKDYGKPFGDAIFMAIEALQKQIPQPVEIEKAVYGTPYLCPECAADQCKVEFLTTDGSEPKEKISYCWSCGQAIDWSEGE